MERATVVLATGNTKKLTELRRLVDAAGLSLTVLGLGEVADYPVPAETEPTFEGNALIKARACVAATGLPGLADDSGLAVDVLNGMPGVRSARWAGPDATDEDNNALLLRQLDDVSDERRGARFVCAMALVLPQSAAQPAGAEHVRTGAMTGRLLRTPAGARGFGYDPLFVAEGQNVTNAELTGEAKDAISHRGKAVRAMIDVLATEVVGKVGNEDLSRSS